MGDITRTGHLALALAFVVCLSWLTSAQQSPPAPPATFEVAAVKRAASDRAARSGFFTTPGRFSAENVSAAALIEFAFRDSVDEVRSIPNWARSEFYTITTTFDAAASDAQVAPMLRHLLAERFQLAFRIEPDERDILGLVRADPTKPLPPRLQPIKEDCAVMLRQAPVPRAAPSPYGTSELPPCFTSGNGRVISSGGISMAAFARYITPQVGRKVIDRTGLPGWYRLLLQYSRPTPGDQTATEFPEIRTALAEQLGLRLMAVRGNVDVLIVERFEPATPD